ncbi:class I poly(R)-hydroxyalkanoic acid synthase [Sphingobium aquiterrae]|uniref:PHA/PHB synthase family protein n=1 Tax=Sphingobium aquiterrae TaxID=2038656 RepID=UPI0030194BE8
MADREHPVPATAIPSLEQMQQWTLTIGQAQQLILEHAATAMARAAPVLTGGTAEPETAAARPAVPLPFNVETIAAIQSEFAGEGMALWQRFLDGGGMLRDPPAPVAQDKTGDKTRDGAPAKKRGGDPRFADPAWTEHPLFDLIRQSYLLAADYLMRLTDAVDGVPPKQKEQLRFATRGLVDALSPSNFPLTNPAVLQKTIETGGENLLTGLRNMLADLEKGQLTQADTSQFELGRNIAATPGKVIYETPLYQLIHYEPTTPDVLKTPLIIFPPWINRFYILDLSPQKSLVKWAVDQGISVFMVSWKSADASMKDVTWDDYILRGQVDAIDTVRDLLGVESVHTIGYCVAGTTLAATLAVLAARGEAHKVASATFFVAQVDFSRAGDLSLFVDDELLKLIDQLSTPGFLDGRYMAATFNLLRARDLIWNYVVNNYLLGKDYAPFDLLYWNGDTTNLPAAWHKAYLSDLYRDNKLVIPGALSVGGTPLDLRLVHTPSYVQAGREDHIAPMESVWKITEHFKGPVRFLLAASGHIAGVVNPPAAGKYGYWCSDAPAATLDEFIAQATENKGSWWPDWLAWIHALDSTTVVAKGARRPGKGKRKAIEDAPGRYVRLH